MAKVAQKDDAGATQATTRAATTLANDSSAGLPVRERRLQLNGVSTAVLEGGEWPATRPAAWPRRSCGALDARDPGTRGDASRNRARSSRSWCIGGQSMACWTPNGRWRGSAS